METSSIIFLTLLIVENLLLLTLILIWLNRHCRKCHKVKCLERTFNQTCSKCKDK